MLLQTFTITYDVRWGIVDTVDELTKRYVASARFAADFVAVVPWEVLACAAGRGPTSLLFSLLRLLRMCRIYRIRETLQRWGLNIRMNSNVVGIANCIMFICFSSHFVACVWFWIAHAPASESRRGRRPFWLLLVALACLAAAASRRRRGVASRQRQDTRRRLAGTRTPTRGETTTRAAAI